MTGNVWVELREISNEEGNRLLRIVRRGSGSVVTWRRAQIVLLSARRMSATKISEVVFTDPDTVCEVIHNFNRDGFDALYPRYAGGRPATCTLPRRFESCGSWSASFKSGAWQPIMECVNAQALRRCPPLSPLTNVPQWLLYPAAWCPSAAGC